MPWRSYLVALEGKRELVAKMDFRLNTPYVDCHGCDSIALIGWGRPMFCRSERFSAKKVGSGCLVIVLDVLHN